MADDGTGSMTVRLLRFLSGGLSQRAWARKVGVQRRQVQAWENGRTVPRRSTLERLASKVRLDLSEVESQVPGLLRLERRAREGGEATSAGSGSAMDPLDILLGQAVDLELPRLLAGLPPLSSGLPSSKTQAKRESAAAEVLVDILVASLSEDQELLISKGRVFRNWAVVERLCEMSGDAAADDSGDARALADLACRVAELVEGSSALRSECQGYAWSFLANARRVGNDLKGSAFAFARAKDFLRAGMAPDESPLEQARPLDLEASLRRDLDQPEDALALLGEALAVCRTPEAEGRVLLKKGFTLQKAGDAKGAIEALAEAMPKINEAREPRQKLIALFNMAIAFCDLQRFEDADQLLPQVRGRSERLGNGLDRIRVEWLEAKVAAGLGREEEAEAGFQRVKKQFEELPLPLPADAALVTLELARLYLRQGRTAETRELAAEAAPVLENLGVEHQAQEALALFWQAARTEAATLDLVERAIDALRRARPARRSREE